MFYQLEEYPSHFSDGSWGYGADHQVTPNGVHGSFALTTLHIEHWGPVDIRLATPREIADTEISYPFFGKNERRAKLKKHLDILDARAWTPSAGWFLPSEFADTIALGFVPVVFDFSPTQDTQVGHVWSNGISTYMHPDTKDMVVRACEKFGLLVKAIAV